MTSSTIWRLMRNRGAATLLVLLALALAGAPRARAAGFSVTITSDTVVQHPPSHQLAQRIATHHALP